MTLLAAELFDACRFKDEDSNRVSCAVIARAIGRTLRGFGFNRNDGPSLTILTALFIKWVNISNKANLFRRFV
jgi:hypothetical protein